MEVTLKSIIESLYIPDAYDEPITQSLLNPLQELNDRQFVTIGDPYLTLESDEVIHAIQRMNAIMNLTRRVGDLRKLYAETINQIREEALKIAEEIDNL